MSIIQGFIGNSFLSLASQFATSNYVSAGTYPGTAITDITADLTYLYASNGGATTTIYRTSNFSTWTSYTTGSYKYFIDYYSATGYIQNYCGSNDGSIYYSTNGSTWTAGTSPAGSSSIDFIVYNTARNEYIASTGSWVANSLIMNSTNGTSWTTLTTFAGGTSSTIATSNTNTSYAYSVVVNQSNDTSLLSSGISQTGSSWTNNNLISVCGSNPSRIFFYFNGSYWFGNSGSTVAKSSADGLSYTIQNKTTLNLPATPTTGGTFIYRGVNYAYISGSNEISFTSDGLTWYKKSHALGTLRKVTTLGNNLYCYAGTTIYRIY